MSEQMPAEAKSFTSLEQIRELMEIAYNDAVVKIEDIDDQLAQSKKSWLEQLQLLSRQSFLAGRADVAQNVLGLIYDWSGPEYEDMCDRLNRFQKEES